MKIPVYAMSVLTLIAAGDMVLAHGSGGGTSTYEEKNPAIKFNIAPTHHKPAVYEAQPKMEMSVEGQTIILKITDVDGNLIDTEWADAKTFITAGGKISKLYLWPAGGNTLSGKGDFTPAPGMRVEVELHLPDREPVKKDFYPLK
jgi:hypothetical protein